MSNIKPILGKHHVWEDHESFLRFAHSYGVELTLVGERHTTDGRLAAQVFRAHAATKYSKKLLAEFARDNGHLLGRVVTVKGKGRRRVVTFNEEEFSLITPTRAYVALTAQQQAEHRAESAELELELRFGVKV